jgi:hypothetical protein
MFLLFVVNSVKTSQVKVQAKQVLKSFIEASTIKQYTLSCVDSVLEDGLEKVTMQGGKIYSAQYGNQVSYGYPIGDNVPVNLSTLPLTENPFSDDSRKINVSYGMFMSENDGDSSPPYLPESFFDPPFYPVPFRTIEDINGFNNNYLGNMFVQFLEGLYGEIHMPKLCVDSAECKLDSKVYDNINSENNFMTIEEQLEDYIELKVKECVNFSYFENQTAYIIEDGEIDADVKFNVETVSVELKYPIKIVWNQRLPVTEIMKFNKEKTFRLSKVYRLANTILKYESFDLFFEPSDYQSIFGLSSLYDCRMGDRSRCYDNQHMTVKKIPNYSEQENQRYDDLILIMDNYSLVKGNPLIYMFMIENRQPVLDYIHYYPSKELDIIVFENQTITLNPNAYDPDNDTIQKYHYSGWREDYYTIFNWDAWHAAGENEEEWDNSSFYQIISTTPKNWSLSQEYLTTEKNATYHVQYGELGYHNVTITVWDDEGLRDMQDIKILVRDLPKAIANGTNNYSDIDDKYASVEDPYILDGSYSYAIFASLNEDQNIFRWKDVDEPIFIQTQNPLTVLPNSTNEYDIFDIINYKFKFNQLEIYPQPRSIQLRVGIKLGNGDILEGEPDYLELELYQCLPHVNNDSGTIIETPYPYLDTPFTATHQCCYNGTGGDFGTIKPTTESCHEIIQYSSLKYFEDNLNEYYTSPLFYPIDNSVEHTGLDSLEDEERNNVFKKIFTRFCDEERGNLCTGDAEAEIISIESCDSTLLPEQTETCYGPPEESFITAYTNDEDIGCVIYENKNFNDYYSDQEPTHCAQQACYGSNDWAENTLFDSGYHVADYVDSFSVTARSPIKCDFALCSGGEGGDYETRNSETGDCSKVSGETCFCSINCGASMDCNGKIPGAEFILDGEPFKCTIDCDIAYCSLYEFDSENYICYDTCDSDNQCAQDYVCDISNEDDTPSCVECDGQIQQSPGPGQYNCEKGCGASDYCDELEPSSACEDCQ